jgi:uncharacterized phage protein (TIGR02218 family)
VKTINSNLRAEIDAGTIANCVKIVLRNGVIHAFTDHDNNLVLDGITYLPAPGLQKIKMINQTGQTLSNQTFGAAWVDVPETDLIAGNFDEAHVEVHWVSWRHPEYSSFTAYVGTLGSLTWSESGFVADIYSYAKNLQRMITPVVTANCRHVLYGGPCKGQAGYCGVNRGNFTGHGAVATVLTPGYTYDMSGISQPNGFFTAGSMVMTSGKSAGAKLEIKSHYGGTFNLRIPSPYPLEVGDTFECYAGCDLTLATCRDKFANLPNFGGFPHIKAQVNFQ